MCGPSEYAQPPYFYLLSVGVVTTGILSNRKGSARGSSTGSTDDDDDDVVCKKVIFAVISLCDSVWAKPY